jgi:DNA-dependent RNA polymerase auxiliary subunit epsilon
MSTQPNNSDMLEVVFQQASSLSSEDKKTLAERLLAESLEEEKRAKQRIKNQAAIDFINKLAQENAEYEEENWEAIQEAINATIKR